MKVKYMIPAVIVATLLVGTFTAMAFDNSGVALTARFEELKKKVPKTFEETQAKIAPIRGRFILWTHDGVHVMWGYYGNGYLTGTDNLGKRAWGIYGKHVFAGFYDGQFFYGRYWRGRWVARGLFGLRISYGRYVLFPGKIPVPVDSVKSA